MVETPEPSISSESSMAVSAVFRLRLAVRSVDIGINSAGVDGDYLRPFAAFSSGAR